MKIFIPVYQQGPGVCADHIAYSKFTKRLNSIIEFHIPQLPEHLEEGNRLSAGLVLSVQRLRKRMCQVVADYSITTQEIEGLLYDLPKVLHRDLLNDLLETLDNEGLAVFLKRLYEQWKFLNSPKSNCYDIS